MDIGDRFPSWTSDRDLHIQLVGPKAGDCSDILKGTRSYLEQHRITNVDIVMLSQSCNSSQRLNDTDGAVFLFLHPTHTPSKTAFELNIPVMKGYKSWVLRKPTASKNTFLMFEGIDKDIVINANSLPANKKSRFNGTTEKYVNKGEIGEMRDHILGQCKNFEL